MRKSKKRKKNRLLKISFVVTLVSLLAILIISYLLLNQKINQREIIVNIKKNSSTEFIVEEFNKYGALKPKEFFLPIIRFYSIISGKIPIAGTYKFPNASKNVDIIRSILSGKNLSVVKVTYPEGITLKDFALITQKHLGIDTGKFFETIEKGNYTEKLGIPIRSIEGYLMPETYFFYYGTDVDFVVEKLIETQNKIWFKNFDSVCKGKKLSRHFVLTLASIIELESPLKEERKRISGVFYNRLQKGMRLESDPTVQYALNTKRRMRFSDLEADSPFNTYKYTGLPPGPICSPGVTSIEAAIFPERHNFLYFVSYGDGSGRHRFASTFADHIKNKRLYKKALKK